MGVKTSDMSGSCFFFFLKTLPLQRQTYCLLEILCRHKICEHVMKCLKFLLYTQTATLACLAGNGSVALQSCKCVTHTVSLMGWGLIWAFSILQIHLFSASSQ